MPQMGNSLSIPRRRTTMSRLSRRHDKLLRRYLFVARERSDAQAQGPSRRHVERLAVRERALFGSIRRIRVQLGLPPTFDPDLETARLDRDVPMSASRQPRGRDSSPLMWSDRPRVKPVPAARSSQPDAKTTRDVTVELISHSARYCARKAAEDLLEHRASPARGCPGRTIVAWPERPLARTANGDIYAGSAGLLMGELVGRAFDGDDAIANARIAARNYIDEFTTVVMAALNRERLVAARLGQAIEDAPAGELSDLRRLLAQASCKRIAVEVRVARRVSTVTAEDVAAIAAL